MKIILEIICWKTWLFCKPNLFLKLNYFVDSKTFRISLCWQFTYLHNLAWTFLRHIYRIMLVYETLKICNLFYTPCTITLVFIQKSMSKVHDLRVKLCEIVNKIFKICFHFINALVLPNYHWGLVNLSLLRDIWECLDEV